MAAGGRVSYGPYRDVSKQLIARLRKFAGVGVIEKASIDEAYIQCMTESQHADPAPVTVMQQAAQLAETIRRVGKHTPLLLAAATGLHLCCLLLQQDCSLEQGTKHCHIHDKPLIQATVPMHSSLCYKLLACFHDSQPFGLASLASW